MRNHAQRGKRGFLVWPVEELGAFISNAVLGDGCDSCFALFVPLDETLSFLLFALGDTECIRWTFLLACGWYVPTSASRI
mmetsp:Transcript_18943/g.32597  ORF Transcript_18943/g.32597 Transcript_18943/m.32597 type:complete len:80 (+) Transcript_18943:358-597(+)